MQHFWMTHFPDYLNEKGAIPKDISKPAFRMAHALSEFISYATDFGSEVDNLPRCFTVRKGKRCIGKVRPLINLDDDSILAMSSLQRLWLRYGLERHVLGC